MVKFIAPEFSVNRYTSQFYMTDDNYKNFIADRREYQDGKSDLPTGEELTKKRLEGWAQVIDGEKRTALQEFIQYLILLSLDFIVFASHWVMAKRAREAQS